MAVIAAHLLSRKLSQMSDYGYSCTNKMHTEILLKCSGAFEIFKRLKKDDLTTSLVGRKYFLFFFNFKKNILNASKLE